ncbi:hypothetical protein SAMN04488589_2209 [Methanolobus vulcani]|jgi:hypothetical protein|uniref:Uncharacterized protein n=1 Tax=Methanolobus vulcani TaxID=38026 RepID=A0A7Z7AXY6_9EURY|nr:hypothetical protein [Methanolobus vulcani]MDK2824925.1 hypothetical protein [Methanolobus sp.]MDK2947228.1 hypothetical protein [Methanolobus sp.]SDG11755.1 hypothetical protein SAMN04488589_2209 [Methanolobus vulcani]
MISEPDQVVRLISGVLALLLFIISFLAYQRERRRKMFLVSMAFFFYAIMGFLSASNIFFPAAGDYLEFWGSFLNFIVLLLFSLALLTKE